MAKRHYERDKEATKETHNQENYLLLPPQLYTVFFFQNLKHVFLTRQTLPPFALHATPHGTQAQNPASIVLITLGPLTPERANIKIRKLYRSKLQVGASQNQVYLPVIPIIRITVFCGYTGVLPFMETTKSRP